jgi:hypothetical protein
MKTALCFDPVTCASRSKAALMAGIGFIDTMSPALGEFKPNGVRP